MELLPSLLVCTALSAVTAGFEWTSTSFPDGTHLVHCPADTVSFPWTFILSDDEFVQKVEWYFSPSNETTTNWLASYQYPTFFPSKEMVRRVQYMSNAGIRLKTITTHDLGTYTVRVSLMVNGSSATEEANAVLSLPDEPVLARGRLHARVSRRVYHDNETDEYHVQLECGTVLNPGDANFSVAWKTPKGHRLSSNSFINGVFYLPLPNPVKGGEYSCRLDRASVAVFKCPESKASLFKAAFVRVSETKSRSLVLETSLSHMKRQLEEQRNLMAGLRNIVMTVSNMEEKTAAFHTFLDKRDVTARKPIAFNLLRVVGGGYDSDTGIYTAPFSGWYAFHVQLFPHSSASRDIVMDLYRNSKIVARGVCHQKASGGSFTCRTGITMHVTSGDTLWVESFYGGPYWVCPFDSFFSGVLVRPD